MRNKRGVHYSKASLLWLRFEAVNSSVYDCDAGLLAPQQERHRMNRTRDTVGCIHAEIALEQSGQILWVTFASE